MIFFKKLRSEIEEEKQELEKTKAELEELKAKYTEELTKLKKRSSDAAILEQTNKKVQNAFAQEKAYLDWKADPNCIRSFIEAMDENVSIDVIGKDGSHYVIHKGNTGRKGQRFFSGEEFK